MPGMKPLGLKPSSGVQPYKGPKPSIARSENPKKFARGMDPVSAVKKFFLYKDVFGNMGGPAKVDTSPPKTGLGGGLPKSGGPQSGAGNVHLMVAARRMGLI